MMSPDEIAKLIPAETAKFRSPIPTQPVSSDEFMPGPQSAKQREFEARVKQIGSELAKRQGVSRRAFFQGATGMAAAFVAMNETFGPFYNVSKAEAATPEMANERANALKPRFSISALSGRMKWRKNSGQFERFCGIPQTLHPCALLHRDSEV